MNIIEHPLDPIITILISLGVIVLFGFIYSTIKDLKSGRIRKVKLGMRAKIDMVVENVSRGLTEVNYFEEEEI